MEGVYCDADGFFHANGIRQLYLAASGKTMPQDILGNLPCHVCRAPVNLRRVFPGESAAAVMGRATIGVAHDLPSGDACVGKAPSSHESPGGIHQRFEILIQVIAFSHTVHNPFALVVHILGIDIFLMLCADQEGIDPALPVIVCYLCFCVRKQRRV